MELKITAIICIIIFLIASFIGYNYLYIPQMKHIKDKQNQFLEEIEKNKVAYKIYDLRKKIEKHMKHFPKTTESSDFISKISSNVKTANLELLSISPLQPEELGKYYKLPVRLKIKDSYHDLGEFVSLIENSEYFMKINNVSISSPEEEEQQRFNSKDGIVNDIAIEINTFYIP